MESKLEEELRATMHNQVEALVEIKRRAQSLIDGNGETVAEAAHIVFLAERAIGNKTTA
ncbi:MAG: hypothetical protein NDI90_00095 [Nitrospira sp. BO4]|jgi:hypothetical protein|nr:hypothetical protein [Nitrospira sp. BO4]